MTDISQLNLVDAPRTDWDNYNSGSKYQAPPPALGPDGRPIIYQGIVGDVSLEDKYPSTDREGNPFLTVKLDPIKVIAPGTAYDGYPIRFANVSVKPFEKNGEPMRGNPTSAGNALKSAGMQAKPQSNSEWLASLSALKGKKVSFTVDWEAQDKDRTEKVKGYLSFPEDPERPGQRKSILKAGDRITERDRAGAVTGIKEVASEVMFANARVKYFVEPANQRAGR